MRRILLIALVLLLTFVYWACVRRYLPYDGDMMFRVTKSLVISHSFQIQDPVLHLNQPYSYYGLAVSLLLVPFFVAGQLLFHDGTILISTFEPIVSALTVVGLLSLLVELGISWRRAFVVTMLYAFASLAWAYSGVLYSEPLVGLCTVSAVLFVQRRWWLAAGCATGLALLARWDSALLVVVPVAGYVVYSLMKPFTPTVSPQVGRGSFVRGPRFVPFISFGAPIAIVTAINLAYDVFRYGRPLASPYLGTFQFSTPLPVGLFGLLFSPGAGLLVYVPVTILGFFGVRALWQRWPRLTLLIAALVGLRLLLYGQWYGWDGGITFGPRFLVPIVPLLFIPIAFIPRHRVVLALGVVLGSLSLGVELINQIVPYGQYYVTVAPALDAAARQQCPGCPLWQVVQLTASKLDYDWQYLPLHGQLRMLLAGQVDPIWRRIAVAVPLLVAILGFLFVRLYRLAGRLDNSQLGETRPVTRVA